MAKFDQKAVLIVIDGWGVATDKSRKDGDAILAADTPTMDEFAREGSKTAQGYTELEASSLAVGLPEGLMGNSEVGHLNIGAGRVVWQDSVRIGQTIKNDKMGEVENIKKSFQRAIDGNGRLDHLVSLLKVAKKMGVPKVFIHFFGDGRDTDPKSSVTYMTDLLKATKEIGTGEIATIVGRYYIMDRDKRWDRVEIGMKGLVTGEGEESSDPVATIKERYEKGENDEFLKPIIVGGKERRVQGESFL
jgi:2,3-bisphosphoglycerate-independent phosphoglycerate mutase